MAIDVYLYIDGIKGESNDDRHKDWIECRSVSFGVEQPKSATASTGGGHTAERCEHHDIVISKLADLSSPILLQTCSAGRTIPKAKFEFMRADAQGERVKYYEIEIENVLIGAERQYKVAVFSGGSCNDCGAEVFCQLDCDMPYTA